MSLNAGYRVINEFLGTETNSQLYAYVLARESSFKQSTIGKFAEHNPKLRISRLLSDLGPFKQLIEQRVLGLVPEFIAQLGLMPFTPTGVEIEAAAHGEGAFYRRHIDLFTAAERNEEADRLISLVRADFFGCILHRVLQVDLVSWLSMSPLSKTLPSLFRPGCTRNFVRVMPFRAVQ